MSPRGRRALPAPRSKTLELRWPKQPMRHFDHATMVTLHLLRALLLRCSHAARAPMAEDLRYLASVLLGHGIGYLPPKERPFTPDEEEARRELCDWCGNLPCPPWPEARVLDPWVALRKLAELLDAELPVTALTRTAPTPAPPGAPRIRQFEGHPITVVEWHGRQIFFVDEVSAALGYTSANSLSTRRAYVAPGAAVAHATPDPSATPIAELEARLTRLERLLAAQRLEARLATLP